MNKVRGNRQSSAQQQGNQSSSLVLFLLIFSGFVAIIGLIYIYGDFSQHKDQQLAGIVEIQRQSFPAGQNFTEPVAGQSSPTLQSNPSNTAPVTAPGGPQDGYTIDTNQEIIPEGQASPDDRRGQNFDDLIEIGNLNENTVESVVTEPPAPKEQAPSKKRLTRVFFIRATDSGYLSMRGAAIEISDDNSPLTSAIRALLKGPSLTERNHGMSSLIPEGSRLISATVRDGVAYLDFSEDFRFNPLGTDGYQAQLQQVVYTATEFPSVQSVQILIEGKKVDYLHEGIYVGTPLSKESFR